MFFFKELLEGVTLVKSLVLLCDKICMLSFEFFKCCGQLFSGFSVVFKTVLLYFEAFIFLLKLTVDIRQSFFGLLQPFFFRFRIGFEFVLLSQKEFQFFFKFGFRIPRFCKQSEVLQGIVFYLFDMFLAGFDFVLNCLTRPIEGFHACEFLIQRLAQDLDIIFDVFFFFF